MEMIKGYSSNANVQMLIRLMQVHGIKKVVISPGTTHMEIVVGIQYNGNFELYSSIDERGAAYMACGLAAGSGEPVAVVCTESVASRNYFSAITDAYYRQLPILAITGLHGYDRIGHLHTQIIDRSISPKDAFRLKVHLPVIKDEADRWMSNILINTALLELKHHGGGPVHIDLPWSDEKEFSAKGLCTTRIIRRYCSGEQLPALGGGYKKIAVLLGTHMVFSETQEKALDAFCAAHDAVVFCGHISGYHGKYRILSNLLARQKNNYNVFLDIDLLIHIGSPVVDEKTVAQMKGVQEVWRVNPDGEIRDTFKKLTNVFEMEEEEFFSHYSEMGDIPKMDYLQMCRSRIQNLSVPENTLPFSNVYVASVLSKQLPEGALIHLGMSNTVRAWSMFDFPAGVSSGGNTGCRGIDGVLSAFLGASLVNRNRLCFCVLGDLTFFYDMNALLNQDLGPNVRILLVNNNGGGLMKTSESAVCQFVGDIDADDYLVAKGHFGGKDSGVVRVYAEGLGFEYLSAFTKEEFDSVYRRFLTPEITDKPMLLEVFTNDDDERIAFDRMAEIDASMKGILVQKAKRILGPKRVRIIKKVLCPRK